MQQNLAVASNLGSQQAKEAGASGPPTGPKPKTKYEQKMEEIKRGSALGVNVQEAIKAHSKGMEDQTKSIKLSIQRQYYTFWQAVGIAGWGLVIGAFIGAIVVGSTAPNAMILLTGKTAPQVWGIMLMSAGLAGIIFKYFTHPTVKHCTFNPKLKVPPEYRGQECISDPDCTDQTMENTPWGACRRPKFGLISRSVQSVVPPVALFGGLVLFILSYLDTNLRPHPTDIAQAVIYGVFGGAMLVFVFSFQDIYAY